MLTIRLNNGVAYRTAMGHTTRVKKPQMLDDPTYIASARQRLLAKTVQTDEGHWLWTGSKGGLRRNGKRYEYGQLRLGGSCIPAHRAAWLIFRGKLAPGHEVDHLCKVRLCVNPDHLEPKTHAENKAADRRTHCIHGHPMEGYNVLYLGRKRPSRICRTCYTAYQRTYQARWRLRQKERA